MFGKILIGLTTLAVATVSYASFSGWGLEQPQREARSVRHGSRHVRRTPYYTHFGRTHGHYYGK
ncbi:MAG: hypothetical protein ACOCX4_04440 [Planctomycetota bacterium]